MRALVGIFVGGASSRMGGAAKGLLLAPDSREPLAARLVRIVQELGAEPVLVGRAEPYASLLPDVRVVSDEPSGVGPLGGLAGLLKAASERPTVALACDLPRVSRELVELLTLRPRAMVLAPRSAGKWEPLCASYDAPRVLPLLNDALVRGVRSFQAFFNDLEVEELVLTNQQRPELHDWDCPEDIDR